MTYVIAEPCVNTKDTACVEVCPVDCIHPKKDEAEFEAETKLYIDPETCIDCGACVPVCPVQAIFPVEEVPPLSGLWAAVTREDKDGKPSGGWHPEERLTLDEALRGYTVEAAYAAFQETHRGRIAPGFVADLTV